MYPVFTPTFHKIGHRHLHEAINRANNSDLSPSIPRSLFNIVLNFSPSLTKNTMGMKMAPSYADLFMEAMGTKMVHSYANLWSTLE